jgi:hypothetical protein
MSIIHEATLAILRGVRKRLEPEGNWIQNTLARDREGREVQPEAREAVCWCLHGAMIAEFALLRDQYPNWSIRVSMAINKAIHKRVPRISIASYNDYPERTLEEVLSMVDDAIAIEEIEEAHRKAKGR